MFESIISGEYEYEEEYWKDISPLAKSFIDSLLVRPAEKRPTATQALHHPWFRAMLESDMVTPTSPVEDSVNLLPGMRKNFNARSAFKKAVRAVGLLRKMQAASSASGSSGSSFGSGEDLRSQDETIVVGGGRKVGGRPTSMGLSFHDIVNAALINKKGLDLHHTDDQVTEEDHENLDQVNAVLEDLTIKDV